MNRMVLTYILLFVLLVLLQVTVLNDISLFGYATPFLYIYFILRLPSLMSANWVMSIAFLMGLIVDICSNTPGMNALAATTIAFVRKPVLALVLPRSDEAVSIVPSISSLGLGHFIGYSFLMVILFCVLIFVIEAFTFFSPLTLILRFSSSAVFTFLLVLAADCLKPGKK